MAFVARPLETVLYEGEVIRHITRDASFEAAFIDGMLHSCDDATKIFASPTGFCNDHMPSKTDGWKACRVYRAGQWVRLKDLHILPQYESDEETVTSADELAFLNEWRKDGTHKKEQVNDMPPPKKTTGVLKKPGPIRAARPILATIIEADDQSIEFDSIIRVKVSPITVNDTRYWFNENTKNVYIYHENGGVGDRVGQLTPANTIIATR